MQDMILFPWFNILVSEVSDGNFSDQWVHPEIIRPEHQAHGNTIHTVASLSDMRFSEVDWVYTQMEGLSIWALCADCPIVILMWEWECAAIHCWWRSTKAMILKNALSLFHTPPKNIKAYIWPHIQKKSYEVGTDFLEHFPEKYFSFIDKKIFFDIESVLIDTLTSAPLLRENIVSHGGDTFSDKKYFSYRRDSSLFRFTVAVTRI